MILVDTSVILDYLKNIQNEKSDIFEDLLTRKLPWGICEYVYQEVLQGAKDENDFHSLKDYLDSLPMYFLKYGTVSFERSARINFLCRRSGVTVRSTIDLLIAETAIENEVPILHNDSDFDNIAAKISDLRILKEKFA